MSSGKSNAASDKPFVGRLIRRGKVYTADPLFTGGKPVACRVDSRASDGDLVLLESTRLGRLRVTRNLGQPDVALNVIEALMVDRGIERGFPEEVELQSAQQRLERFQVEVTLNGSRLWAGDLTASEQTRALAEKLSTSEILRRIRSLEEMRDHLGRNVQEALAIEVAFLSVFTF